MTREPRDFEVVICSNTELLSNCFSDPNLYDSDFDDEVVKAIADVLDASPRRSGFEIETDNQFHHWQGGRHYQFGELCGHVAIHCTDKVIPIPQWLIDLAEEASSAGDRELEYLEELELKSNA